MVLINHMMDIRTKSSIVCLSFLILAILRWMYPNASSYTPYTSQDTKIDNSQRMNITWLVQKAKVISKRPYHYLGPKPSWDRDNAPAPPRNPPPPRPSKRQRTEIRSSSSSQAPPSKKRIKTEKTIIKLLRTVLTSMNLTCSSASDTDSE